MGTDAGKAITHSLYHSSQIIRASVCEFLPLYVPPDSLDGVQLRGIGR